MQSKNNKSRSYFIFVGDQDFKAKGNPCRLVLEQAPLLDQPLERTAVCYTELSNDIVTVSCVQNGQSIACCGHGLLAAGHHYLHSLGKQTITLQMHGSNINAHLDNNSADKIWLNFNPIELDFHQPPQWLEDIFPNLAQYCISAAKSRDDNGYWVFEWTQEALEALTAPEITLSKYSQRALINTCHLSPAAIGMRYFAPQYGNIEDTATGSAMRVVACYWQRSDVTAYQLSIDGGVLFGRFDAENQRVSVGGYCRLHLGDSD